jgi:hypothetical protein
MCRVVASTLALALCLLGCTGEVKLLTGGHGGCSIGGTAPMGIVGELIADPRAGTAIRVVPNDRDWPTLAGSTVPVMWPPGFTGRRLPSGEVEVIHPDGVVIATTGRRVALATQFMGGGSSERYMACGVRGFPAP